MNLLNLMTLFFVVFGVVKAQLAFKILRKYKKIDWGWHVFIFTTTQFITICVAYFLFKDQGKIGVLLTYLCFTAGTWFVYENHLNALRGKSFNHLSRHSNIDRLILIFFMGKIKSSNFFLGEKSPIVRKSFNQAKVGYFIVKIIIITTSLILASNWIH